MKLIPEETSLVVAGAWNLAILNPTWVQRFGLEKDPATAGPIQAFFPATQGPVFEVPRFALDEFSYVVRPDSLIVSPSETTAPRMRLVEDVVARIIDALRHTPVSGIGHNFQFRQAPVAEAHLNVFTKSREDLADNIPEGWAPVGAGLIASFKHEQSHVVANLSRFVEGEAIIVKFNFHHQIASTEQALHVLRGEDGYVRMTEHLDVARNLLNQIYDGGGV